MDSFVHLHCHTEFSMLDGAAKNAPLFAEAERLGMPALAMTDHGNMFGAYEFFQVAKKSPVKPIIGIEAYVAPSSRHSRVQEFWSKGIRDDADSEGGKDVSGGGRYTHMTMWAADATGLRNLFRLSSLASFEGYYMKPRMDFEIISQYSEGIIATTGCPSGAVQTRLRLGQYDEAVKAAALYRDLFGPDRYFVELMDHGLSIETEVRADLLKLAKELGLRTVATNDSHYVTEDQADAHDNLLCIGVGRNKDDPKRFRFNGSGYFLRSSEQMRQLFWDLPEACDTTLDIAEMVGDYSEVFDHVDRMPRFQVPEGHTQESWLRHKLDEGVALRYGANPPQEVLDRIETELAVIEPLGFSPYFLIVSDICRFARDNGIRIGPGRGSATGSMVAYLTRITELDPIEHGLIFERFLNPERVSPPDVDLDVDDRHRDRIIAYFADTYGSEYTAQVNTFSTIKAKNAIKDSSRILGYPFAMGEKIVKAMPNDPTGKVKLPDLFDPNSSHYAEGHDFRALYDADPDVRRVVETGKGIEGLTRGTGVHAAAVILSSAPLLDLIPLHMREDGVRLTGFSYPQCEEMGLMKMDVLGLRNLGILDHALALIEQNQHTDIDLLSLPLDDAATYAMLGRAETLGVFQLDGGPMRQLLRQMGPTRFEDIAAVLALYRPGPMAANAHIHYAERKNGREKVEPIHPELAEALEPILGSTFHLLIYQEQLMAIARELAGYTYGGADLLRRAMGKKKKEIIEKEYEPFKQGMAEHGYSPAATKALWDVMAPFAEYAFNKSHTAGYGLVSYWTAYLKCHYPAEYMSAVLQSVADDKDKSAVYLAECRRMGLTVLPPDVNESDAMFTPIGSDSIRFGLTAVRNVGANVVDAIVRARNEKGKPKDYYEFLEHCPSTVCNKRVIESLIKAGAFDSMGAPRRALFTVMEGSLEQINDIKKNEAMGQDDLFGAFLAEGEASPLSHFEPIPDVPEWDKRVKLAFEREMLGLYVSDHPLNGLDGVIAAHRDVTLSSVANGSVEGRTTLAGLITSVTRRTTKKGDPWAQVTLEDLDTSVQINFFPKAYLEYGAILAPDTVVQVQGRVNPRDEGVDISAERVVTVDTDVEGAQPVTLSLPVGKVTRSLVGDIKGILGSYPGSCQVWLQMSDNRRIKTFTLHDKVDGSSALISDLKALLGPSGVGVGRPR
ncbi:MAG: DNA polymerase III subunit alpha [Propionibacteriaceae bacterium]|jgi:DNA polymerase-3 subunit alpha|nr:DNA polymerase III subunit alpha [Propionibacteriaceae bacterium]